MKWKQILLIVAISSVSAVGSVLIYSKFVQSKTVFVQSESNPPVNYAGFFDGGTDGVAAPVDFTQAANTAVQAVVHIKTKIPAQRVNGSTRQRRGGIFDDFFDQFFDYPQIIPEQKASGSGVIISPEGYIITNNHVITNGNDGIAEEITVTLHSKKTYKARVIGRDPSSDLAVLKIDADKLPYLIYGNSDDVKLGQWVLAVGYPLTLETTVTAGIVSAKGRTIGINNRQSNTPVESFIQTDAAVNSGNSGGALVNTVGELIGINSAILAPSGTYAGYSFAIPANLAKKIVNDIIEFGNVQRGYLGIQYPSIELSDEQKKELGIKDEGVYVSEVSPDGAAAAAGIKKGDVITKVNNNPVTSGLEMSAQIAAFRPGDKVAVSYKRNGKEFNTTVTLKAKTGSFDIVNADNIDDKLGAQLETIDSRTAARLDVEGGVRITQIVSGGPISRAKIESGFVITSVNGRDVKNVDELVRILNSSLNSTFQFKGVYPGYDGAYTYPVKLNEE